MGEVMHEQMKADLIGKPVDTEIEADINGVKHVIKLLAIKKPKVEESADGQEAT
jgi:hypothetical protein